MRKTRTWRILDFPIGEVEVTNLRLETMRKMKRALMLILTSKVVVPTVHDLILQKEIETLVTLGVRPRIIFHPALALLLSWQGSLVYLNESRVERLRMVLVVNHRLSRRIWVKRTRFAMIQS